MWSFFLLYKITDTPHHQNNADVLEILAFHIEQIFHSSHCVTDVCHVVYCLYSPILTRLKRKVLPVIQLLFPSSAFLTGSQVSTPTRADKHVRDSFGKKNYVWYCGCVCMCVCARARARVVCVFCNMIWFLHFGDPFIRVWCRHKCARCYKITIMIKNRENMRGVSV